MEKKRNFLGFLASLFMIVFTSSAFAAAGYVCSTKQYTSCNAGYYLTASGVGNSCSSCTSVDNKSQIGSVDITGGRRIQTCTGKYESSKGDGTIGTAACTGCSASTYTCSCNSGYHVVGSGASCTCAPDCSTSKACSTLGSEWSGTYDECKGDQGSKCSKSCSVTCSGNNTAACPANATCTYNTSYKHSGTQYYGGTCNASGTCPVATVTCNAGYYKNANGTCTACEDGYYCTGNNTRTACTTLGSEYTKSDGSRNASSSCYRSCTKQCTCPTGANCTITNTNGTQHYGGTCNAAASVCTVASCQAGRYKNNNECPLCNTLGDKTYTQSAANNTGGATSCYKSCTKACTQVKPAHATTVTYGNTSTNGTQYYNGTCSAATSNCSVTVTACETGYKVNSAKTGCDLDAWTITYNTNGGTNDSRNPANYTINTASFTFYAPSKQKPGYTFDAWYREQAFTNKITGVTQGTTTGNLSLYAKWNACAASNTAGACGCTSAQHPNGSGCANCVVSCAVTVGYTLGEYNVCNGQNNGICYRNCTTADVANSSAVSGTVKKSGTKTCAATSCNANYWLNNGACSQCVANATCSGGSATKPTCNTGYTWNSTTKRCDANPYKITLNANGGSVSPQEQTCYHNTACAISPVPARANYTFLGWSKSSSCTDKGTSFTFTSAATLYACWEHTTTACQAGKYYNATSRQHESCPVGYYCPGTGNTYVDVTGCRTACVAGQLCNGGATQPGTCPTGQICSGGRPSDCPDKSYCSGGFSTACPAGASGADKNSTSAAGCYFTCPGKSTAHGTLSVVNAKEYYNTTSAKYPACTYTAHCDDGYTALKSPGVDPSCMFTDACPEGSYCTGGVKYECPADPNGLIPTSEPDSEQVTECYVVNTNINFAHGSARSQCYWNPSTRNYTAGCIITALSCDAGYYYNDENRTGCSVATDGYYSGAGTIYQTQCPAGYSGSDDGNDPGATQRDTVNDCYAECAKDVNNALSVTPAAPKVYYSNGVYPTCIFTVECETGYHAANNNSNNPSCPANEYIVVLNKNGGTGNIADSINCTFNSGACMLPGMGDLKRAGYSSDQKWCSTPDGELPCYPAGSVVTSNISPTGSAETLYAKWTPRLITVNLNGSGAQTNANPATVYMRYEDAWYYNADITSPISALSALPEKTGYIFTGYYSQPNAKGTMIIDSDGTFVNSAATLTFVTETPATIYAAWVVGKTTCPAGTYYTNETACTECPANHFCPGGDFDTEGGIQGLDLCADLGDGEWQYSDAGAKSANACYRACEEYRVTNGTATPINDTEQWPSACQFSGTSDSGNPCDIIGDACMETSCISSYELINGICEPCAREYAMSYEPTGNCVIKSCESGYHSNKGLYCEPDVMECSQPNAAFAEQTWNHKIGAFSACIIKECDAGYHIASNACVPDEEACVVENGIGTREWDTAANRWGECIATSCNPGYTNDPGETNERTKQCGQCKNKFSTLGQVAVSSYAHGCEIATCMYQGELYNLDGNECVPICEVNGYSDETGTRKWDAARGKCVQTCNEGFVPW